MKNNHLYWLSVFLLLSQITHAQSPTPPINWQLLDWNSDGYPGMSVGKTYTDLLKGKKPQKKIIVAIIDDGLDDRHPDLAGMEWTNTREIPGNGIDDDHNGYVDDIHGWNFIGSTRQETFEEIREYVRLHKDSSVVNAGYWTMIARKKQEKLEELTRTDQMTANVIDAFITLQNYWRKKLRQDSVYFVQVKKFRPDAAGNDGLDTDTIGFYPSAFGDETHPAPNFITVGASTYDSTLIGDFSNYGKKKVDVFAPGVAIYMTKINAQHERGFGTSFACPMVAGAAALIWSYYPRLTYQQVRECIQRSATPIDLLVTIPGSDKKAPFSSLSKTGGIVNVYRAIRYAQSIVTTQKP